MDSNERRKDIMNKQENKKLFTEKESLKIATMFIKKEESLEILFLLENTSKTMEELNNIFKMDTLSIISELLDNKLIYIDERKINISQIGKELCLKLQMRKINVKNI